jgi:hypothetical protein
MSQAYSATAATAALLPGQSQIKQSHDRSMKYINPDFGGISVADPTEDGDLLVEVSLMARRFLLLFCKIDLGFVVWGPSSGPRRMAYLR